MEVSRRSLITGIGCIIAAPAIVRASSLMAIKPLDDWVTVKARVLDSDFWLAEIERDKISRTAWAKTLCVDIDNGNNFHGTGSVTSPYRTLAFANDIARPGDTIILISQTF